MKGATAEILVRISRPPSTIIMTKMGSSQNFFLARIKYQSSIKVSIGQSPKTDLTCFPVVGPVVASGSNRSVRVERAASEENPFPFGGAPNRMARTRDKTGRPER